MAPCDADGCINVPFNLKIQPGGPFFQDIWFDPHRDHFIVAVQYLLNKWGEKIDELQEMEVVDLYRTICHKHMKEDATIFTQTEDDCHHKIIFNVDNLQIEDLHVSSNGNYELLVHGNPSMNESLTTPIPKIFRHNFTLSPDVLLGKTELRLSSDGILTIIIPREKYKKSRRLSSPKETKENINSAIQKKVPSSPIPQITGNRNSLEIMPSYDYNVINSNNQISNTKDKRKVKLSQAYTSPKKKGKCIPMIKRGKFFNDPIFQDSHKFFNEAVKQVLIKCNIEEDGNEINNLENYRKLRESNLIEETQAIITLENNKMQKIIIDVWDFIANGQLKLKDVDERHLLVKGRLSKNEGGISTIKCFKKAFLLPENTSLQHTAFDMSSDGILTITSPKP